MEELAIVYVCAGISSRFEGKIKQFARVGPSGETLIEYSLAQALPAGFTKIIFVVGNKTEQPFKEKFGNSYQGIPVFYALQKYNENERDKPWGTADAVCCARDMLNCPFVVCNSDDLYGKNTFKTLFKHLQKSNEEATIGYRISDVIPEIGEVNRAKIETNSENYITSFNEIFDIEKQNLARSGLNENDLCGMNIYALNPRIVALLCEKLALFKKENAGERRKECLIQNVLSDLIKENKIKMKLYSTNDKWYGITNPEDEFILREQLKNSKKKETALVYICAGISARFGGRIKQFSEVGPNGESLIECSLKQALPAGFTKIIFVVGNKTEQPFKEKFGNSYQGIPVFYALQKYNENERDKPWGTGDALCSIREIIDCPFVFCNGDDLYGKNSFKIAFNHLQKSEDEAAVGYKIKNVIPENGTGNRAVFKIKGDYIESFKEVLNISKADFNVRVNPEDLCSMNLFAFHPRTVNLLHIEAEKFKEKNKGNRKIEFFLSDELSKLVEKGKIKMKIYSSSDTWIGITNPEDEEVVKRALMRRL